MGSEEKMSVDERYKYLRVLHGRYERASRQERGHLLDEAAAITVLERKYLCHLLNSTFFSTKTRALALSDYLCVYCALPLSLPNLI